MIDKNYQPSEVEGRIYRTWEEAGAFRAGRPERAGAQPYTIAVGDRIAQLLLVPVAQARLKVVREFAPSQRGEGGFGSTGVN